MRIQHHSPQNKILQKYIEYYYFLKTDDSNFDTKYFAFPNILTPVSIHKNVDFVISETSTEIIGNNINNHVALVQGMRKQPLFVNLHGKLDKITIIFKPLGLNNFIRNSFAKACSKNSQIFKEWEGNIFYKQFLQNFYTNGNQVKRIKFLEDFLLSVYQPIEDQVLLENIIILLNDFDKESSIENIAQEFNLSVRTLNRLFKRNLGISPIGFKKIARFRHSLNNKMLNEQFKRLTDIAYNSNFYDQSHFINVYKKMTGSNPKNFFELVEKVGDDKLLFQFLK